ncbi:hypothetical protein, partial [Pseudomonas aeruginosa]|uniref:hypothetical protein n=1 Tax=Pseudomonas aeruginosa TaxID=287 RepID=UPI00192B29DE
MSSTQHQLIKQCATRLRGIVEALDNIHDTSPHRWSTDLDEVHSSAESLLALINDQAPTQDAQGLAGTALRDSPASVEQAGVDERAVFEFFVRKHCGMPEHIAVNWDAKFTNDAWEGWKARATLAQPSPASDLDPLNLAQHAEAFNEAPAEALKPEQAEAELDFSRPLETENGEPVKWICADVIEYKSARVCVAKDTGLVYSSPYIGLKIRNVMPEQAEAERPEVVAYRTVGRHAKHQHPHFALNYYKQNAEDQAAHWRERGCEVSEDELMTVAQHERITAQLHDALDESDGDRWKLRSERDAANARLHEVATDCATAEQERDAALAEVERLTRDRDDCLKARLHYATQHGLSLARVAELTATRNRYGVDAHYFNKNLQRILRDFESFTPDELARSLIILAKVADEKVVAQHSVPQAVPGPDEIHQMAFEEGQPAEDGDGYLFSAEEFDLFVQRLLDSCAAPVAQAQHSV